VDGLKLGRAVGCTPRDLDALCIRDFAAGVQRFRSIFSGFAMKALRVVGARPETSGVRPPRTPRGAADGPR
jgi:hypothetical protein